LTTSARSPLGQATSYPERYDPALLYAIDRGEQRRAIGLRGRLPFSGVDLWTAYEVSWLDAQGKPQVAIAHLCVPCESPALIESKSLKLYLGSFAQEPIAESDEVVRRIEADLSAACGARVGVTLAPPDQSESSVRGALPGECIDAEAIATQVYEPDPATLSARGAVADETLRSALLRARCPVTGQPDCGDVMIRYRGRRIDRAGLLRYVVSYRGHAAFHESCVERMFVDLLERCAPEALTVYARFVRRGGIDINPFRSNFEAAAPPGGRTCRQ
jgi:7-cyano-7-deazaguanine reductase